MGGWMESGQGVCVEGVVEGWLGGQQVSGADTLCGWITVGKTEKHNLHIYVGFHRTTGVENGTIPSGP